MVRQINVTRMNRRKKKKFTTRDDAVRILETYPKTKVVYDCIKEHPNTDARMIADALGEQQVYTHVNRLEDYMLVTVQKQRERHYSVKHYTVNELTTEQADNVPLQQEIESSARNVKTKMNDMTDESFKKLFLECLFDDLNEDIIKPDFRLNIGGVDCVSSGCIVAVTGKPGVGKSTAMAIVAGVLIGGKDFGLIQCKKAARNILWIDTEKDPVSCNQRMKTLRNVAGLDAGKKLVDQGVQFLCMKTRSIEERIFILEKITEKNLSRMIYDVVFIDGIFDLTDDPGNLQKVTQVMELLKRLSGSGATVFGMLHTNKKLDDDNMREVIGTEYMRLCNNRFLVKYDAQKKIHNIIHDKSNDTKIAPIVSFQINDDGVAVPAGLDSEQNPKINEDFKKDFETILSNGLILPYNELVKEVVRTAKIGNDMAKKRISKGYKDGYLDRDSGGKYWLKKEYGVTV